MTSHCVKHKHWPSCNSTHACRAAKARSKWTAVHQPEDSPLIAGDRTQRHHPLSDGACGRPAHLPRPPVSLNARACGSERLAQRGQAPATESSHAWLPGEGLLVLAVLAACKLHQLIADGRRSVPRQSPCGETKCTGLLMQSLDMDSIFCH